jgi:hypothetical protein
MLYVGPSLSMARRARGVDSAIQAFYMACEPSVTAPHYGSEVEMTDIPEVTGRDDYIIARALYEFVRLEQSKPLAERRKSDEQDAKAIFHARFDDELEILVAI